MEQAHDFHAVLKQLGNPVVYYPRICQALQDDLRCGIFLSNFQYWEGKQKDPDGWIYKKQTELWKETGLGRYAQEQARKKLKELGILEEKLIGKPPMLHYRFNWARMNEVLNKHFAGQKVDKIKVESEDPLLYRMKVAFNESYEFNSGGFQFDWGNKVEGGKYWKGLKDLQDFFKGRIENKRKKDNPEWIGEVSSDEIVESFTHFLSMLPDWVIKSIFAPHLISAKRNEILMQIIQNGKAANGANQSKSALAEDFVK